MGKQRIVISERDNIAALFEDDKAMEFIIHRGDCLLGDVYLAHVENILPSIDAGFVNVGLERMGFLHSSDMQGHGDVKNKLQPKQNIVVQVIKEPTGHKGPRVTMSITLPGRFLVLLPQSRGISISRKIMSPKERMRLKSTVSLMKPPGVGVIIRTEAEGQSEPEIQEDFETLIERWQNIVAMADTAKPPTLLYRDQDLLYRVIRESVTEDVTEIMVDTQFGQQRAKQLIQNWGIEHSIKVTQYSGNQNFMMGTGIDKEIKNALQTRVPLPSGGYLYIQPTEALTVIDVNSGKFTSLESQAETIRLTNLEAAKEIARQLRLRNIGGMIIVDFIDMESRANQLSILEAFEAEMAQDKGKPQIGQLSDLGLVEMTRHRQGQSLSEIFTKKCNTCHGSGLSVEDFNWSPSSEGGRSPNHRMPLRGGQRHQRSGGGQRQKQDGQQKKRNAVPKPQEKNIRKLIEPGALSGQQDPLREGFLQMSKKLAATEEQELLKDMPLQEVFQLRLLKKTGLQFSNFVKLGQLPLKLNVTFSRMNPRANDIFTLVDAIEEGSMVPMPTADDDGDDADMPEEILPVGEDMPSPDESTDNDKAKAKSKSPASRGRSRPAAKRPPSKTSSRTRSSANEKRRRGRPPKKKADAEETVTIES